MLPDVGKMKDPLLRGSLISGYLQFFVAVLHSTQNMTWFQHGNLQDPTLQVLKSGNTRDGTMG